MGRNFKNCFLLEILLLLFFCTPVFANYLFEEKTGEQNPFDGLELGVVTSPAIGDIDGDSDLEALVGSNSGTIRSFSLNSAGDFIENTESPLISFTTDIQVKPTLFDWNGDDFPDLFVGKYDPKETNPGMILYYENDQSGNFTEKSSLNPFVAIDGLGVCKVTFGEFSSTVTGQEAFVGVSGQDDGSGGEEGALRYFILDADGEYVEATSPLDFSRSNEQPKPFAIDYDQDSDGLFDILVGLSSGTSTLRVFLNNGSPETPNFSSSNFNSLKDSGTESSLPIDFSDPIILNFDGDNQRDLFLGTLNDGILYFEEPGGIQGNFDCDTDLDINDAILGLKILSGFQPTKVCAENEVTGDGKIGIEDVIYVLRVLANP